VISCKNCRRYLLIVGSVLVFIGGGYTLSPDVQVWLRETINIITGDRGP
jgi:hypothetical protein